MDTELCEKKTILEIFKDKSSADLTKSENIANEIKYRKFKLKLNVAYTKFDRNTFEKSRKCPRQIN